MARSFDRSGLDDKGIGGGSPAGLSMFCVIPFLPFVVLTSCGLFIPKDSADRAGIAGGLVGGDFLIAGADSFGTMVCGGRAAGRKGKLGGVSSSTAVTSGMDFVGFKPILDLSMS